MFEKLKKKVNNLWGSLNYPFSWNKKILSSIATIGMVIATFFLAFATHQMSVETKNLVELNTDQFKIKSYPTFLVSIKNIKYEENSELYQEIHVTNKGEVTAHNTIFLPILVYKKKLNVLFENRYSPYLISENDLNAFEYESKLYKDASINISLKLKPPSKFTFKDLRHFLFFIRFSVPYDKKYCYEIFGFDFKKKVAPDKNSDPFWQRLSGVQKRVLLGHFNKTINSKLDDRVKKFFEDYNPPED